MVVTKYLASLLILTLVAATAPASTPENSKVDDRKIIQALYDFLSNPGSDSHAKRYLAAVADDWNSISDYSGTAESKENFVAQLKGFATLVPDLKWSVEEVLQDGNRIIVRGRATGTPSGPFFGVNGNGKSFDIMSIDIHIVENGKIQKSFHVEDWAGAIRQLSAN